MINRSSQKNLKTLWWLRNIAIIGQACAILTATEILHLALPVMQLWLVVTALLAFNIFTYWRVKTARRISDIEFFAQLLVDITALFTLLYFTGGASNPFASLFILQVIIAAITLQPLYTWLAALVTVGFYTLLMVTHVDAPHFINHMDMNFFSLHVQGMWLSFIMLAVIVAWLVVRMNNTICRQNVLLAEAEKVAAIGTLAASAAHELGTPLATMLVLTENGGENSNLFKEQLLRCKQIISRITASGGVMRAGSGSAVSLAGFIRNIIAAWQSENPLVRLTADLQTGGDLRIVGESGLEQAIRNLLDNAADAAAEVQVNVKWNSQVLKITIADNGAGLPDNLAALGEIGFTSKDDGMGLGLFLTRSIISRLEGKLELKQQPTGALAAITLPLKRLAV